MTLRTIARDLPQAILVVLFLAAIICGFDLLAWLAAHPHAIELAGQ